MIDEVIPEPLGGAHQDHELAAKNLRSALLEHPDQLTKKPLDTLLDERYEKFRKMGKVFERRRVDTLCHYPKLRRVRSIYARAAFRISSATLPSDFACLGLNHGK